MTGLITIHDDVGALLTPAELVWLQSLRARKSCRLCSLDVSVGIADDAVVIVDRYLDGDRVGFAHARCTNSQVRYMGKETPDARDDIEMWALLQPSNSGMRATLLLQPDGKMQGITSGGDTVDLWTNILLELGWTLLRTVGKRPTLLDGWVVEFDPIARDGRILAADGSLFLDHLPLDCDRNWIAALLANRELTILSGADDFQRVVKDPRPLAGLNAMAREGHLVGGRVAVTLVNGFEGVGNRTGRELATALQRVSKEVATRAGTAGDSLVPLTIAPLFKPAVAGNGDAALLVDLNDNDAGRVRDCLVALELLGFPRSASSDIREHILQRAPEGWGCLVWRSQVKIVIQHGAPVGRQLWFAPLAYPSEEWYRAVSTTNMLGVIVGNGFGRDTELLDLVNGIRGGVMLGASFFAMTVAE